MSENGFHHPVEHLDSDMVVLQANIDDMNPEWCSFVADRLFEAGANDVFWIPIIMKKGRPGVMLNVLVAEEKLAAAERVVFAETTTIGLRYMQVTCHRLAREFVPVMTPWGVITVKAGYQDGRLTQFAPEFSECERAAREHGVPLKDVYDEVRRRFGNERAGGAR